MLIESSERCKCENMRDFWRVCFIDCLDNSRVVNIPGALIFMCTILQWSVFNSCIGYHVTLV